MQTWLLKLGLLLFRKPKFRQWARIEDKKSDIIKAVEKNTDTLYSHIYEYISTALVFHPKDYSKIYWKDVIESFLKIHYVTVPDKQLPLVSKSSDEKSQAEPWEYPGRLWFFYCGILANAFGWTDKQIANLSVDDALAYVQEVLTKEQLDREFIWSTTTVAYSTEKGSKQSKFNSLKRPYWMQKGFDEKKETPTVRVRRDEVPMGVVKNMRKNETKETEPTRNTKNLLSS